MFKPNFGDATFVCLTDLYHRYTEYNPIIFNPQLPEEENKSIIKRLTKKYFGVDLTETQLSKLVSDSAESFVRDFKHMVV